MLCWECCWALAVQLKRVEWGGMGGRGRQVSGSQGAGRGGVWGKGGCVKKGYACSSNAAHGCAGACSRPWHSGARRSQSRTCRSCMQSHAHHEHG